MSEIQEANVTQEQEVSIDNDTQELAPEINEELELDASESQEEAKKVEEAKKDLRKKLQLKIDGEEFEEELDWNDEDSLKRYIQKAKAFDKRSKEFSTLKSQVQYLMDALQNNPAEILAQLGHNVDELAEKHLAAKIEELKKSPEELEREKMQKELEKLKKEKDDIYKKAQEAQMEQLRSQYAAELENDILTALKSDTSNLPDSPYVIKRIAQTMYAAMQKGYNNVTAKDVIPVVTNEIKAELQQLFGKMPETLLEQLIGKGNLDRIRKTKLKNYKTKTETAKQIAKDTGRITKNQEENQKPVNFDEYFNLLS